ncbi:hypothetical protein D9758_010021 [Tetrapyrgos nigripes]|uniref:Uncharacterized protein n=1 Tax=Tetrapyrgos nigripes TaxID=182062 RepID=A0A8H5CWS5_9AGAR|nr:hypothetical protein D9758_010021 [Tetrapyrgos nigripes]
MGSIPPSVPLDLDELSLMFISVHGATLLPILVAGEAENADEDRVTLEDFSVLGFQGGCVFGEGYEAEVARYHTCELLLTDIGCFHSTGQRNSNQDASEEIWTLGLDPEAESQLSRSATLRLQKWELEKHLDSETIAADLRDQGTSSPRQRTVFVPDGKFVNEVGTWELETHWDSEAIATDLRDQATSSQVCQRKGLVPVVEKDTIIRERGKVSRRRYPASSCSQLPSTTFASKFVSRNQSLSSIPSLADLKPLTCPQRTLADSYTPPHFLTRISIHKVSIQISFNIAGLGFVSPIRFD